MPDPQFFKKAEPITVGKLADILDCQLQGNADREFLIQDVSALKTAKPTDLSFLDNIKYRPDFKTTKAGACFVSAEMAEHGPAGLICLITKSPYKAYARAAAMLYPELPPQESIAETAFIHPSAKIGKGCVIEHNVYIGADVEIGDNTWLEVGCVIQGGVKIGKHCRIGVNASVSHAIIGDYTRLYTGVRIGQDGFGFAIDPRGHIKVPQLGRVILGNHIEIGANTTIDRGSGPDTVIGDGTWIDNLVQIGHNVVTGKGCILVAQSGISGSTTLGDFVAVGGQAGIAGHLKIGTGARIAGQSGVMRDIPAGEEHMGTPAFPIKQYMRQVSALNTLIKRKKSD